MKALGRADLRQEARGKLGEAGFTSIKIMPSSFYARPLSAASGDRAKFL